MPDNTAPALTTTSTAGVGGFLDSIERMLPGVDDLTFWLVLNIILFLYVGIEQLANGYGPGTLYSAGAVLLAVIYMGLWMLSKTNKKMGVQLVLVISGLAVLGDLVVIALKTQGYFTGTSALVDFAGLMLLHSAYKALKGTS